MTFQVHYAALNDLDVKRASGVVSFKQDNGFDDNTYGMDFSGLTDRLIAVLQHKQKLIRIKL